MLLILGLMLPEQKAMWVPFSVDWPESIRNDLRIFRCLPTCFSVVSPFLLCRLLCSRARFSHPFGLYGENFHQYTFMIHRLFPLFPIVPKSMTGVYIGGGCRYKNVYHIVNFMNCAGVFAGFALILQCLFIIVNGFGCGIGLM